jgi:hypothetical protein
MGNSNVFGRDSERLGKYSREHTAYADGKNIPALLKANSIRTESRYGEDFLAFNFIDEDVTVAGGTIDAKDIRLDYSRSYYSTFNYNAKTKTYYKTHCGNAHMDTAADKQLNFTNVFVLETDVDNYKGGSLMEIDWTGGEGYYISMGKAQKITWIKSAEDSNIQFFAEDGTELKVNTGKSYIGVIGRDLTTIKGEPAAQ